MINIAALMVLMDLSAINIALPSIRAALNISVSAVSLILVASMLTATSFALIIGKVLESYPPNKILLVAFLTFGITSSLSALCTQLHYLIIIRLVQGFAEAALYVSGPALIKKYIPKNKHQKEYGLWMTSCGLGISLGPIIGGLLIKYLSWEYVFLINAPLAILGIYYSIKLGNNFVFQKKKWKIDYSGAIYSFLFLALLIVFIKLISSYEISNINIWLSGFFTALFMYLFLRNEKKSISPIINFKLFNINSFKLANIGFHLFFFVNVGSRFLRPFYFEETREFSSSLSGILMMISPTIMLLISLFIHKLERIYNTKQLIITGNVLLSISMLMFSFWNDETSLIFLCVSMIILGVAMGIYYPTTTQFGMKNLPDDSHGMGSATISISKSLGKLFGVLIISLLFQFFYEIFIIDSHLTQTVKSQAIQYVFIVAFIVSILNTAIFITSKK